MKDLFLKSSVFGLIYKSDIVTKIVLIILLIMSIFCWSIAFYKLILLKIKNYQAKKFLKKINRINNFEELIELIRTNSKNFTSYFISKVLLSLKELIILKNKNKDSEIYVKNNGIDFLFFYSEQVISEIIRKEESKNIFLSISAGVAPLLGLFGTVWGLVQSFISINEKNSADIVTVAPGIAEALITTIAGLLVAIPAMVLFYIVLSRIRKFENRLFLISDKFIFIIREIFFDDSEIYLKNGFLFDQDDKDIYSKFKKEDFNLKENDLKEDFLEKDFKYNDDKKIDFDFEKDEINEK